MANHFIVFEGCEGSGKTTQVQLLAAHLREQGETVIVTREPGGTLLGEAIRGLLQHDDAGESPVPTAEIHLFAASRAQHVAKVIRPGLAAGNWVLCDRFVGSSAAYQGAGREFGIETVLEANRLAVDGLRPSVTFLLDLDVDVSMNRVRTRSEGMEDRFEREAMAFHKRVREGYLKIAQLDDSYQRLDASVSVEALHQTILDQLANL